MNFASDNWAGAHPDIAASLAEHSTGHVPAYGASSLDAKVEERLCEIFERKVAVYFVATGTAANSLSLAAVARPGGVAFAHSESHMMDDECGAPEFLAGGARLCPVDGALGRIDPENLEAAIRRYPPEFIHAGQPMAASITQATEVGTAYSLEQIAEIAEICRNHSIPLHMDGARFANALMALECSPAEMTWRAGIDAVSFGGTKNGLMGVEALVMFDAAKAWEFELRRKRGAHLFSKHRFLSAQMLAYLDDGLWLEMARAANEANARLVAGLRGVGGVTFAHSPDANMTFATWPRALHRQLFDAGAQYHLWDGAVEGDDPDERLTARLVCDWSASDENTARFLELLGG